MTRHACQRRLGRSKLVLPRWMQGSSRPVEVEAPFVFASADGGVSVKGVVDRVDREADGGLVLREFKSGLHWKEVRP